MADPRSSSGSWLKINSSSVSSPPLTALSPARATSPVVNAKYTGSPLALAANNSTTTPPNHAVISAALVAPRAQPPPSSLASSIDRLASFMSTSFPTSKKNNVNAEQTLDSLKEDFERKIGSVVYCLQEKAEENIDLSNKIKSLQEQNRQKEAEKDKLIGELQASIKSKDEQAVFKEKERSTLEEIVNEFTRRLQTITLCLNDMAEENLRLRNQLEEQSHPPPQQQQQQQQQQSQQRASSAPKQIPQQQQNTSKQSPHPSASIPPVTPTSTTPTTSPKPTPATTTSPTPTPATTTTNPLIRTSSSSITIRNRSSSNADTSPAASFTASTPTPLSSATFLSTMLSSTPANNNMNNSNNTNSSSNKDSKQNVGTDISGLSNEDFTILVKDFLEDADWLKKFGDTFLKGTSKEVVQLLSNIVEQDKTRHEKHVTAPLNDQIQQIDQQIKEQEEMMVELKSKLQKENDKATSFSDSVVEYEKKVKELESRMWDNLNKEAQRRGDAEFNAKRLKKKVEELQFLLDELKDESNSSLSESGTGEDDESDDSDDEEEEKASKNNKSKAKT